MVQNNIICEPQLVVRKVQLGAAQYPMGGTAGWLDEWCAVWGFSDAQMNPLGITLESYSYFQPFCSVQFIITFGTKDEVGMGKHKKAF